MFETCPDDILGLYLWYRAIYIATGPSAEIQNSIGSGVLGGVFSGTVLAILFVPVFFVLDSQIVKRIRGFGK